MLPVNQFPIESFEQNNPVLAGIGAAQNLYAQSVQNRYLQPMINQQLQSAILDNQIKQIQAQFAPKMSAAQLAYLQSQAPLTQAQTQNIVQAQIPLEQSNANLMRTEAAKNQFALDNPGSMSTGIPNQMFWLHFLNQKYPGMFRQTAAPPDAYQRTANNINAGRPTSLPGMPSAGPMTSDGNTPSPQMLPRSPYGAPMGQNNQSPLPNPASGNPMAYNSMPSPIPYRINTPSPQNINNNLGAQNGVQNNQPQLPPSQYGAQGNQQQLPNNQSSLPSIDDITNLLYQGVTAPIQKQMSQTDYNTVKAKGYNFSILPPDNKRYLMAQAAGMGIEPLEALNYFNNGYKVADLARMKGLDPNNLPSPLYSPTSGTVNLIQKRSQALSEINTIMPNITNAMAPYARRFDGWSPSQIADAITNDNPDQQARFLAAKALMPEMASLRLKAMGGNIGIEAIREVNDASMGNIKSFQGSVSPKVYATAQKYIDQWINQGANAASDRGLAGSVGNISSNISNGSQQNQNTAQQGSQTILVRDKNGVIVNIPANNLQAAIKRGATRI